MKYVVLVGDGMADEPWAPLFNKTPLEDAYIPNMDMMARQGIFGMTRTIPEGLVPGSEVGNLSIFGYDPGKYNSGRSALEAVNVGVQLEPGDITYRCNLVTLSETKNWREGVMLDFSGGELPSADAAQIMEWLNERFQSESVRFYPGVGYRNCLVIKNGKTGAELTPPHDIPGQPVKEYFPKGSQSELLSEMMEYASRHLSKHPVVKERKKRGKPAPTGIWFWGEGEKPSLPSFEQRTGVRGCVISAVDLVRGIGKCAGMKIIEVPGITGNVDTNFDGKAENAIKALKSKCDLVYIHVEAPDECGHRGLGAEKVWAIQQIDKKILGPVLRWLESQEEEYGVLVMPDHPTPLVLRTHTGDPVPFAIYHRGDRRENPFCFTESSARLSGVFVEHAWELMDILMKRERVNETRRFEEYCNCSAR